MNRGNGIYVMTCTDIRRGNWSAPQPLHLGPVGREDWPEGANPDHWDYNLGFIDPGHVVGEDGKRYLFVSGGFMVGLSDDGLRVVTKPRKVYEPWPIPDDWFIEGYYIEAMSLFKRGEYFYLMAAQGGTFGPATGHNPFSAHGSILPIIPLFMRAAMKSPGGAGVTQRFWRIRKETGGSFTMQRKKATGITAAKP